MTRCLSRLFLAAALAALAAPALAQNTASLAITANVNATCKVTTTTPAITINYDVFSPASATGTTDVQVRCTKGTTVQVAANTGLNGGVPGFLRSVKSGSNAIGYTLSLASGGTELGNGVADSSGVASAGKGSDVIVPIHVALDTAVDPAAGAYTDTVVLTYTAL